MLTGFVSSAVSMQLPGPGSCILEQTLSFSKPLYHYGIFKLLIEVTNVDVKANKVRLAIVGKDEDSNIVLNGEMLVSAPYPWKPMTHDSGTFENF